MLRDKMTEDWTGFIEWMKEYHGGILLFLWNRYMSFERRHEHKYLKKDVKKG
jgi:hypothetical protein